MDELHQLQAWYASQCDGDWEHEFGIKIENVDNPGWSVSIPLAGTELETVEFETVSDMTPRTEWMHCRVVESADGPRWEGSAGPLMLSQLLRRFLDWASAHKDAT
ncbi:MAG: immunity 53 family protein [Gemmatimonadota bacterium]